MLWMKVNPMRGTCGCGTAVDAAQPQQETQTGQLPRRAYAPAVDVVDSEAEAVLVVDIPGVPEGGVDLSMEKNVLTLTAVPADGVIAGRTQARSEHGAGEYRRSFALPDEVDRDRIEASLKNGVLRVRLPKRTPVMKKISVVAN